MSNHTYRPLHALPTPRRQRPAPVARIVHYDPRTLARSETPLRPVAVACARCSALIPPDEAARDLVGDFVCADADACDLQVARNAQGGR